MIRTLVRIDPDVLFMENPQGYNALTLAISHNRRAIFSAIIDMVSEDGAPQYFFSYQDSKSRVPAINPISGEIYFPQPIEIMNEQLFGGVSKVMSQIPSIHESLLMKGLCIATSLVFLIMFFDRIIQTLASSKTCLEAILVNQICQFNLKEVIHAKKLAYQYIQIAGQDVDTTLLKSFYQTVIQNLGDQHFFNQAECPISKMKMTTPVLIREGVHYDRESVDTWNGSTHPKNLVTGEKGQTRYVLDPVFNPLFHELHTQRTLRNLKQKKQVRKI